MKRVKGKGAPEARDNQFSINVELTIAELTFTTQKASVCSLLDWLFCYVVPFLGKFGPKTQIVSLS